MSFALRFPESEIAACASRYQIAPGEEHLIGVIAPEVRRRGYCTMDEFLALGDGKSPRSRPRRAENAEEFVREVTRTALATPSEQLRLEVLMLLRGVSWPTASALLHFVFADPLSYPVAEYRALWALGIDPPPAYSFPVWWGYVEVCRVLARRNHVAMRTLDRALWQYAKENQP
jgi:hypothetical protein